MEFVDLDVGMEYLRCRGYTGTHRDPANARVIPQHFDCRVWIGAGTGDVVDYLAWQSDVTRCGLSPVVGGQTFGPAYTLRQDPVRSGGQPRPSVCQAASTASATMGTTCRNRSRTSARAALMSGLYPQLWVVTSRSSRAMIAVQCCMPGSRSFAVSQ